MTKEEMLKSSLDAAYLAKCAVDGVSPDLSRLEVMDFDLVFKAARRHMIAACAASALNGAGVVIDRIEKELAKAKHNATLQSVYGEKISAELEERGVWHVMLKGYVTRDLYPEPHLRQMSDIDVLFDGSRREEAKEIMESFGFTAERYGVGKDDVYTLEPSLNVELHVKLFEAQKNDALENYYLNIYGKLVPVEGKRYTLRMTDEDFFVYMIAHEYKHFDIAGTGIRQLLDTYVYLRAKGDSLDTGYVFGELEKLGIADYAKDSIALSDALYSGNPLDDETLRRLDVYIRSGVYGTFDVYIEKLLIETGKTGFAGKASVLRRRIFMPEKEMKNTYPFFYRHRAARPLLPVVRGAKALTVSRKEFRALMKALFGKKK